MVMAGWLWLSRDKVTNDYNALGHNSRIILNITRTVPCIPNRIYVPLCCSTAAVAQTAGPWESSNLRFIIIYDFPGSLGWVAAGAC